MGSVSCIWLANQDVNCYELAPLEGCAYECAALNESQGYLVAAMATKEAVSVFHTDTLA